VRRKERDVTTIVPTKFFPPKTQGYSHNIKGADGLFYGCPDKFITLFQLGQPVEVELTIKEKDGRTYRDIKRVIPNGNGHPAPAPQASAQAPHRYGGEPDATAERIYCAGILNNLVGPYVAKHGAIDAGVLIALTNAARQAWAATFGAKTDAQ
jgi:hypothetical protein